MSQRPVAPITQVGITRALKAAIAAGIEVGSYEIDPKTGKLVVHAAKAQQEAGNSYDRWKAGKNGPG